MSPAGRGRPRDPDADAAILNAALELFLERGLDGTSFEQVAKRAGVAKLTLYRRWRSKEELLSAAIEQSVRDSDFAAVFPSEEEAETMPVTELIERVLPMAADSVTEPSYAAMVAETLGSAVRQPSLLATYWEHHVVPRRRIVGIMLERARAEGRIPADTDIDVTIDMIVGALMYRVLQPGPFGPDEARRYLEALYRQAGLLDRRGSPDRRGGEQR